MILSKTNSALSGSKVNGVPRCQVTDVRADLQMWIVTVNILKKNSGTADKRQSYSIGFGRGIKTPPHKILACYETSQISYSLDG
jgi:hypothetical protein